MTSCSAHSGRVCLTMADERKFTAAANAAGHCGLTVSLPRAFSLRSVCYSYLGNQRLHDRLGARPARPNREDETMKKLLIGAAVAASLALAVVPAAEAHDHDFAAAAVGFALGAVLAPPSVVYGGPPAVVYTYPPAPAYYGGYAVPAPRIYIHDDDRDGGWRHRRYRARHWRHDRDHRWHRERRRGWGRR